MTTAQELLDAGVDPKNIPTLTAELNKPEFGGLADTEFMVEAGRFGNTDANLQLGLNWWWDTQGKDVQIFDTGEAFDSKEKWLTKGRAYPLGDYQADNTGDDWAQDVIDDRTGDTYKDGKDWFDHQKSLGNLRPEVVEKGFEKWKEDMRKVGKDKVLVMYAQSINPLDPETWSHELSHIGQFILRESGINLDKIYGTTLEGKQRIRDIMMSSPGPEVYDIYGDRIYEKGKAYEENVEWTQQNERDDQGNWIPYTEEEIRAMARDATLENQLANQLLESQGGLPKPIGDLSQYEEQHMPGFWQSMTNKAKGWFK